MLEFLQKTKEKLLISTRGNTVSSYYYTNILSYTKKSSFEEIFETALFAMPLAGLEPARLSRLILSQVRLPIPPQRHVHELLPICKIYIIIGFSNLQAFFKIQNILNNFVISAFFHSIQSTNPKCISSMVTTLFYQ